MNYKITKKDSEQQFFLWDAEAELLIALLAKRLSLIRNFKTFKIINDLNFNYLRKTKSTNKKNYTANYFKKDYNVRVGNTKKNSQ